MSQDAVQAEAVRIDMSQVTVHTEAVRTDMSQVAVQAEVVRINMSHKLVTEMVSLLHYYSAPCNIRSLYFKTSLYYQTVHH